MSTTNHQKTLYKNHDGEIFDPEGAIKRHTALANIDVTLETDPSGDLEFTTRASSATMARLCQILNAAPVNGDPLHATVNLKMDTTAGECEVDDIMYYLLDNGEPATLESVAAAYLHEVETDCPLELDIRLGADTQKFAVTRITSRYYSEHERLSHLGKCLSHIDFKIPGKPSDAEPTLVTVVSEQSPICIENLEGRTIGEWHIIRALKPVKQAKHGGFILERLEEAPTYER